MQITTNPLSLSALRFSITLFAVVVGLGGCDQTVAVGARSLEVASSSATTEPAVVLEARVIGVSDGDTLKVLDGDNVQHTIRLAEIDAPERGQPWGQRSKQTLSELVSGKPVSIRQTDTDRYGRTIARVTAGGVDVNRAMIERGAAWAYRTYLTDDALLDVEARARRARVGLWSMSDAETVAPWEWRRGQRKGTRSAGAPAAGPAVAPRQTPVASGGDTGSFSCSTKRYCREMTSCAEAHFYLEQCGVSSLDGNGDGEPCEALCGTMR